MQAFLLKNLTLNQTEEMPGFQRIVELMLLLLSIRYDKFTDYKQVLRTRLSESGVVKFGRDLLEKLFMEAEDDESYVPMHDRYDDAEENDYENAITMDSPVEALSVEHVEAQMLEVFRQQYTNDGLHVCKSIFHKHFGLYLYDEGIEFSRILKFKLEHMCENPDIEDLVI